MASVARAIEQAASCTLDASLWWDSHDSLFQSLDLFLSSAGKLPLEPVTKSLQANHTWLLETLSRFKMPNAKSRSALDVARVVIGDHTLEIKSDLKNAALQISKQLVLDEVQSYILVSRYFNGDHTISDISDSFQKITLKYYMERQCLLKCVRLLLLSHMAEPSCNSDTEALDMELKALVNEGLEDKLFTVLEKLLTIDQPLDLDMMFVNLWAEQAVVEEHLVMDIIFLLYFSPLCTCRFVRWKELFIMFKERIFVGTSVERLSLTADAMRLIEHVKHQSVLILLETLDLDKLLLMVYDDVPFSQDRHSFSVLELQEIDRMLGGLNTLKVQEYAPLLLGWGTFVCLASFLPTPSTGALDLNHTTYIQQAHEGEAFKYLHNMLCHQNLQETNIDGYKCVIKSIISTFVAAFDILSQNDTATMDTVVDILYLIYSGQEVLCAEFWDRENILDSPLRNLLYLLRENFPHQTKPLVQLLAGLAEGAWPAECVYDFLYRPSEITCIHEGIMVSANINQSFITTETIPVQGVPGLLIPAGMSGQCLRVLKNQTSIVLWKCKHSAIVLLVLHLLELACEGKSWTDAHAILNLLQRMLFSNKMLAGVLLELNNADVCEHARADGRMEVTARVEILAVMRMLLDKLLDVPDYSATAALCTNIFGVFSDCCTYKVMLELGKSKSTWSSSNSLEEDLLAKLLSSICKDSERSKGKHLLVISVLDLCKPMVSKGAYSESLCELVIHAVGILFLNHMTWKYEEKYERWKITAKVFELAHLVLSDSKASLSLLKARVLNFIILDPAFHDVLIRILSVNMVDLQGLYFNRYIELKDIEWFEAAITEGFLLLHQGLSTFFSSVPFDDSRSSSPLEQALLHHTVGTMPFVECAISLIGYPQNQALQLASIKMLTTICIVAGRAKPHPVSIASYIQELEQKQSLRMIFAKLISKETADSDEDLFNHSAGLVIAATKHQPSFVQMILSPNKEINRPDHDANKTIHQKPFLDGIHEKRLSSPVDDSMWNILTQPLFESKPKILSKILLLLRCLWEGGSEFPEILESFRQRDGFWTILTSYISNTSSVFEGVDELVPQSFQYCCQAYALQIIVWELFLQKHKAFQQYDNYSGGRIETNDIPKASEHTVSLAVVQLLQATDPAKLIQSFAVSRYNKEIVIRAKAEMRILLVGLMLKMLMEETLGLSVVVCDFIQDSLKAVLNHLSFQKLSSTYLSRGYGHGKELYILVVSDLYFHLQGELEAGRHIPAGSFEDLVHFLDTIDLTAIINSHTETPIEGLLCDKSFSHNVGLFRQHVGVEWWPETTGHVFQTAENALHAMQQATTMACLGDSQGSALEALTSLFSFFITTKELVVPGLMLNWKDVCIVEVCNSIQSSLDLLGPDGDPAQYIQRFLSVQLTFLLVLLQWFSVSVKHDNSKGQVSKVCTKVVSTVVTAAKPIMSSCITIQAMQRQMTRSLLGAYLVCLELLQTQNIVPALQEAESKLPNEHYHTTISNVTFKCAEFLPFVCSLIENKWHASLAVSLACILIEHFLAPQIWLPILQMHSTIGASLSLLHVAEDTEGAFQILNLLLSLSHVRTGVEMLLSAGIFTHILVFTEKIKEKLLHGEGNGPFCVWKARTRKHELWGLSVAIVAAIVKALGENNRDSAVESAFIFLQSQKEQVLQALQSPGLSNKDSSKMTSFGHSETTISALQETHQVLHLIIALVRHHAQWFRVMGESEADLRHKCIHLLAYIAREGLFHNVSSGMKISFHCCPVTKEDVAAHRTPSMLNATAGWFGLAAKGAAANGKIDTLGLSQINKQSSLQLEALGMAPTAYSDSVALHVYKVSLLLLELFCKQAHQAATVLNEGGSLNHIVSPEFPAPEILYGMQDQVISIIKDMCGRGSTAPIRKEAEQTCCLLLSILEKTLFLEAFVSRICGIAPLSVRADDFMKDFKALLNACEGHQCLDASLKALKPVISLAYPMS